VVVETGYSDTYGNYIRVKHLFGFETRYAHLSKTSVEDGSLVVARAIRSIGEVGSTGRATGPHLHFEVRWLGVALPPRFFLVFHGIRKTVFGF
jgi:murein DD-endopeptidase MepM/ murein hydrolase activator NlpD